MPAAEKSSCELPQAVRSPEELPANMMIFRRDIGVTCSTSVVEIDAW
jgi:hypothetical protein